MQTQVKQGFLVYLGLYLGLCLYSFYCFLCVRSRTWPSLSRCWTSGPRETCNTWREWRSSWKVWRPSLNRWRRTTSRTLPGNTRYVNISLRVAKFRELSIHFLFFLKSWLEDSGVPAYFLLMLGIFQPRFWENQGFWKFLKFWNPNYNTHQEM